jgi:hypothetical protein
MNTIRPAFACDVHEPEEFYAVANRAATSPAKTKKGGKGPFGAASAASSDCPVVARSAAFRPSLSVFPGLRPNQPLSENAFSVALRTMGYMGNERVAHGVRMCASSMLNEQLKFPQELREVKLAHAWPGVWGTYDRSKLLDERRAMMETRANSLDQLRSTASQNRA